MENINENIEVMENPEVEQAAEETESKRVDVAGLAELGLMIVGGVVVAKKVIKTGCRAVVKWNAKRAEKKAAKEAEKAKKGEPAPEPVKLVESTNEKPSEE